MSVSEQPVVFRARHTLEYFGNSKHDTDGHDYAAKRDADIGRPCLPCTLCGKFEIA